MSNPRGRLERLLSHLGTGNDSLTFQGTSSYEFHDDDVVIVSAVRTPICKAKRGAFASVHWTQLLSTVMNAACERAHIKPEIIEDVQVGTALAPGGGAHPARMAQFVAGFPETSCISTTNRQCSSGLQSIATIAAAIKSGYIEVGMAAGVESMSSNDMTSAIGPLGDNLFGNEKSKQCLIPMGVTSENVAQTYNIGRNEQDDFALRSHQLAYKAQQDGLFREEIVPVTVTINSEDGSSTKQVTISNDDGIRSTSMEALKKLRPAFKQDGTTTAGNSSQVSDGAAAVILMTRRRARELGIKIMARFVMFTVAGVPPQVMGIGPAFAIPKVLQKSGLTISDIDVFEINEAFASQAAYCVKELNLDIEKVNPLGGAIALGHPLGATGARQVTTLLYQLRRTGGKYGVVSMCIGTGMGAAAVFAAE